MTTTKSFSAAALIAGALSFTAPAMAQSAGDLLKGGAIGGLGGAAVGALVPGISTTNGALIGAAGGAAIGGINGAKKNRNRHHYRDARGNSYWVDHHGKRHYYRR